MAGELCGRGRVSCRFRELLEPPSRRESGLAFFARPEEHAEFDALTTHAWRARNFNGVLLMELPSADGTKNRVPGDTPVTVEIPECRWGL